MTAMATDESGRGKTTVERDGSGLRITVFAAVEMGSIVLLGVFLVFWAIGEVAAFLRLLAGDDNMMGLLFWVAMWTVGGLVAAYVVLWQLTGKEIIELDAVRLTRRKLLLGLGPSREYKVADISDLRPAPYTYFLGSGLDEGESRYVIEEMCRRVKSLCAQGSTD
jgi:hypothetical protein